MMKKETKKTADMIVMILSIVGILGVFVYILYQSLEYLEYYWELLIMSIILAVSGLGLIAHPSSKTTAVGVSALAISMLLIIFFML